MLLQLCFFLALYGVERAVGIQATADIYYHEQTSQHLTKAVWTFSDEGLHIFSVNGEQLKRLSAAELDCGAGCSYFDVVTDGHKYVWASAHHVFPHRVDVFSIETGDYLGATASCNTPLDMDYVPNREELWIRCGGDPAPQGETTESDKGGHLSVIQTNAFGGESDQVRLNDQRTYGYAVFHSSLGNYGYASGNNANVLWKVDMAQRKSVANFTMDLAHSAYDMTYSPVNKHIFVRSRVCCTCGFDGADTATCGRFGSAIGQNIQTGPSIGRTDLEGTCGVSCEGSVADTIGVMEFDTVSETFIGSHQPLRGFGATPEASPDGRYIVLFANDGGQNLRVLRAGSNGEASTLAFDIAINFENVPPGKEAVSDFAFVNWNNHNLLVLASGYDNHLAVIDLTTSSPTLSKVLLSQSDSPTGGNGGRMVEWAYGTDYVWVDGSSSDEVYVLRLNDVSTARSAKLSLDRTISNVPSVGKMIYVENFSKRATYNQWTQLLMDALIDERDSEDTASSTEDNLMTSLESVLESRMTDGDDDENKASLVAILALIMGAISIMMNLVGFILYLSSSGSSSSSKDTSSPADDTEAVGDSDVQTLGSKHVA